MDIFVAGDETSVYPYDPEMICQTADLQSPPWTSHHGNASTYMTPCSHRILVKFNVAILPQFPMAPNSLPESFLFTRVKRPEKEALWQDLFVSILFGALEYSSDLGRGIKNI